MNIPLTSLGARSRLDSAGAANLVRCENWAYAMGTLYRIVAYAADQGPLESAVAEALAEARRLDRMLSNYLPDSDLSQVNRFAARRPVHVSDELFELLLASTAYSRESEGTFDITVGPLMKALGFYKGVGGLPSPADLHAAAEKVGYWKICLDIENKTVRFARDGVELDPGGIGKGYAVDKMVELLKRRGINTALISGGASTIYGLGAPPGKSGWKVTIKNPRSPSLPAATVSLKNESIATTASYEKFFWAEGQIWSHIVDPRTGYPVTGTLSVSVIAPRAIDSEVWAKPYYILGRSWSEKHKPNHFRICYCNDAIDTPCGWI